MPFSDTRPLWKDMKVPWDRKRCFDCGEKFDAITMVCQACADFRWATDGLDWLKNLSAEMEKADPTVKFSIGENRSQQKRSEQKQTEKRKKKPVRTSWFDD